MKQESIGIGILGIAICSVVFILGSFVGAMGTKDSIYDACLERNKLLTHEEATRVCKEFVK